MAYSKEVIIRAQEQLAQAKADRESENLDHLHRAYELVPRIREIDQQLQSSMAAAARAVFTQGGDPRQALEQVRKANLALQAERKRLELEYFDEGYLDDGPICDQCGGLGYVGSNMCSCLRELCRQEQKRQIAILASHDERFENFRLDYYPTHYDSRYGNTPRTIMQKTYDTCCRYARDFTPASGNLLFIGDTGLGKTFLSACIARTVADKGYSVDYETASRLMRKLEKNQFSPSDESQADMERLMNCDLLIIDDLGTELPSNFVNAALYSLINDRLVDGKPMIISTNLNIELIGERYTPQIASRLAGSFRRLAFVGDDIRKKKNRGI